MQHHLDVEMNYYYIAALEQLSLLTANEPRLYIIPVLFWNPLMLGAGNIIADFPEINIWRNKIIMITKDKHCSIKIYIDVYFKQTKLAIVHVIRQNSAWFVLVFWINSSFCIWPIHLNPFSNFFNYKWYNLSLDTCTKYIIFRIIFYIRLYR